MVTENEFEKKLLAEVIPPGDIGVTFEDIGALENVKETLKELVMLPLQRPELFSKGQLTKVLYLWNLCELNTCYEVFHLVGLLIRSCSLVKEYCSLGLLVLVKLCLQKLLLLKLVQTL